mgnify:CR=1 FL=1
MCVFVNCSCSGNQVSSGDGGGASIGSVSRPVFSGCVFSFNRARNGGGVLTDGRSVALFEGVFFHQVLLCCGEAYCSLMFADAGRSKIE